MRGNRGALRADDVPREPYAGPGQVAGRFLHSTVRDPRAQALKAVRFHGLAIWSRFDSILF